MKHNPKFIYPTSTRASVDGHRHYDLGAAKLPSVTTILSSYTATGEDESTCRVEVTSGRE
jgi:hypothetical protein